MVSTLGTALPVAPLPDDVIDRVAREVALEVKAHVETMYPDAARAVSWPSASRSIQGVIRNRMAEAGRAAESGRIDAWLKKARQERRRNLARWRAVGVGFCEAKEAPNA